MQSKAKHCTAAGAHKGSSQVKKEEGAGGPPKPELSEGVGFSKVF